ncbi:hypothetical protein J6590_046774 [Homalodisca vitripennis]|nr:hypothetical protein J6590_046774 [Homalodisca vitripennis]
MIVRWEEFLAQMKVACPWAQTKERKPPRPFTRIHCPFLYIVLKSLDRARYISLVSSVVFTAGLARVYPKHWLGLIGESQKF